jgi:hypothetical protein
MRNNYEMPVPREKIVMSPYTGLDTIITCTPRSLRQGKPNVFFWFPSFALDETRFCSTMQPSEH